MNHSIPPTIVAFGGNALVRRHDHATQRLQIERADVLAEQILPLLRDGCPLVLVHGNGPQVGDELIRVEESVTKAPPLSVDLCVAATEGTIGVLLERALRNAAAGEPLDVVTVVTLVEVDATDPALQAPTKPVGPHFNRYRAEHLMRDLDWKMVEESPGAWRKVVASPRPRQILNMRWLAEMVGPGRVLIAAGGGGVPVARDAGGRWVGVDAVIDKDYVADMLGRSLGANRLLMLTDVERVALNFGTPQQEDLELLSVAEARAQQDAGQFPPGSMGPKMEAAIRFVTKTGGEVLITAPESLGRALAGRTGTRVVP